MDISIIYFSQTGNTQKVARAMADVFQKDEHQVRLVALEDANADDATRGDLLGVGTPCFSSRAPQPVMRFLDALPSVKNHKAFVFSTCGGAPGKVLYDMAGSLRKKGVDVFAGHLSRGEVHHPAPALKGRFPGRPNTEDLNQVHNFARIISASLQNPSIMFPRSSLSSIRNKRGFYEFLGSAISDRYIRFFLPEPRLNRINCDQCGHCSQECPTHNIHMEPYPVLGSDCIRCYHCFNICPSDAFALNWYFGNPILWLLYNPVFERWFGDLKSGERVYE
jgi:flavodoxin/NAD-dependent dihydropyrimidine dehydrogenase PreA subunit